MSVVSPAAAASGPCGTTTAPHAYQHVIWIWMENRSFGDIIGNKSQAPYINSLAASCGLAAGVQVAYGANCANGPDLRGQMRQRPRCLREATVTFTIALPGRAVRHRNAGGQ